MRSCGWISGGMEKPGRHVWCEFLFSYSYLGYPGQDFDWADYLKQCGAEAAPQRCFPPVRTLVPSLPRSGSAGDCCASHARMLRTQSPRSAQISISLIVIQWCKENSSTLEVNEFLKFIRFFIS